MKQLMMIGYGAMAQEVAKHLPPELSLHWVLVPARSVAAVQARLGTAIQVISSVAQCDGQPDFVIEVAGQSALREHAEQILQRGWSLGVISVGALTDSALYERLQATAEHYQAKLHLLAGAIAGIDGLAAAKIGGLHKVLYQGRKSPRSWQGSAAEQMIDLAHVTVATTFFRGTAREAAAKFPANANVAATIALAGLGMDDTMVELMVDPSIQQNKHTLFAEGAFGELQIEMMGQPLASNPKTSTLAALSVVRACRNYLLAVQV
jgi:aspartate dehydrogenase